MNENLREEVTRLHAQLCYALADPNRILIIYTLSDAPKNVNDIANSLNLSQPKVSRHLKILRENGIVRYEREGTTITYYLKEHRLIKALDILRNILADNLGDQAALAREANQRPNH